jgi:hypothetical protein
MADWSLVPGDEDIAFAEAEMRRAVEACDMVAAKKWLAEAERLACEKMWRES